MIWYHLILYYINIILYYIVLYHIISYYIILYHIISYYVILYYIYYINKIILSFLSNAAQWTITCFLDAALPATMHPNAAWDPRGHNSLKGGKQQFGQQRCTIGVIAAGICWFLQALVVFLRVALILTAVDLPSSYSWLLLSCSFCCCCGKCCYCRCCVQAVDTVVAIAEVVNLCCCRFSRYDCCRLCSCGLDWGWCSVLCSLLLR